MNEIVRNYSKFTTRLPGETDICIQLPENKQVNYNI